MYFRFKRSYLLLIVVVTTLVARSAATRTTTLGSLLPAVLRSRSTGDLEQVALAVYRTVADPDLHAQTAVSRRCLFPCIVDVRTQRVLVDELRAMGFDCAQATVSRDIADMGLRKLPEGIYVLAEDLHLQRMVSELVTGVLRTDNLVMIKAQPGTASGIAAAVDAAELPDVLGSLAGNDTILVIAQTAEDGERLEALINKLSNSRK